MTPSQLAPHHLALKVRDLEQAERFYAAVLGLPVVKRWADGEGRPRSIWLLVGPMLLMLERSELAGRVGSEPDHPPFSDDPPGWHLFALRIPAEGREAWRAHLESAGFPVLQETGYTLYVQDPEGNRVGLSHYPLPDALP